MKFKYLTVLALVSTVASNSLICASHPDNKDIFNKQTSNPTKALAQIDSKVNTKLKTKGKKSLLSGRSCRGKFSHHPCNLLGSVNVENCKLEDLMPPTDPGTPPGEIGAGTIISSENSVRNMVGNVEKE